MAKEILHRLSKITPSVEMDTVERARQNGYRRAFEVLMEAQQHWNNMSYFRKDRERNKRYTYGDQWKDVIKVDGCYKTEEEYIKEQGNVPLKNNLIRRLVRNVLGVYRSQAKEPTCTARDRDEQKLGETMSIILQCNMQMNRMNELYARTMEEFLISGLIVHRKWFGWRNDKCDCWTDYVQPNNFFIDNHMRDFRGWDVNCLGEVHDVTFETLCQQFAESPDDYQRLKRIYTFAHNRQFISTNCERFGYSKMENYDFLFTSDPTRCRVIEVWRRESKPRYRCHDYNNGDVYKIETEDYADMVEAVNRDRLQKGVACGIPKEEIPFIKATWFMDDYWYFYYLTPFGDILKEGETPYEHKSHPYVFKAYPYIDSEIHSFVSDVIDQQRYTNRLITLYDWIMRASAKGVLLFPEECLPKGMSLEDIADEWSRFNGVIAIKAKAGNPLPQQIANNSTNIGITELLNIQLKFFEDISGVNGALQGKPGFSGMSASLYSQQTQNATTSLLDLLESFSMFVIDSAYKDVKNIQQYYDTKRVFNIAGKSGAQIEYDPKKIRDIEFDLSITESTSTPAYRQMANDFLMEIWRTGQISLQQLLQHGDFPFADELLQSLQSQQEQMEQGQTPGELSPEMLTQIQQGANMDAVNKAYGMLRGEQQAKSN
ncbi:hypothetical protein OCV73_02565 [Barnesiella propionica]|uniref:portal protein n=1 Tax=Barnesiella propionica TaxID=2981781 RepID=UPI0011CC47F1|nr:hypothetical protein [Barnesiella propionica]MCU6767841.1 hypothetical protein [Barnesiella propionica]